MHIITRLLLFVCVLLVIHVFLRLDDGSLSENRQIYQGIKNLSHSSNFGILFCEEMCSLYLTS